MKNKWYLIVLTLILMISLSGCVQNNDNQDNKQGEKESTTIEKPINNSSNGNEEIQNMTSEDIVVSKDKIENKDTSVSKDTNSVDTEKEKFLKYIETEAIKGVNIYCEKFKLSDNISDVIEVYGEATEQNYVSEAKGTYYNFEKDNLAFGCNKGDEIFEIRSYNKELNKLKLNDIERYFGKPDYENKTTVGERIIGYKVSSEYKILFVFNNDDKNEYLDHYSVFYPEITANYMANDPGREW